MKTRTIAAALCLWFATSAHAVGRMTEATDLWWVPSESGWGINVIHHGDVLFVTFFVYNVNRFPVWYSASDVRFQGANADGALVFTGDLYETTGPWITDFFDPASVRYRKVGSLIFRMTSQSTATLVYNVDQWTVHKQLTRFTMRLNEFAGSYLGSLSGTLSSCPDPNNNGRLDESSLQMQVEQTPTTLAIRTTGTTSSCHYTGGYTQTGRLGAWGGTYTCTNGTSGNFQASEIEANPNMFSARLALNTNNCNFSGRIGGVKRD